MRETSNRSFDIFSLLFAVLYLFQRRALSTLSKLSYTGSWNEMINPSGLSAQITISGIFRAKN